jgi:hypothetical protein
MTVKPILTALLMVFILVAGDVPFRSGAQAQTTDFTGTVLMVDPAAGKLAVKKDGGTRFTFVINAQTQFDGKIKRLTDLNKGDAVTVQYQLVGSQYVALKVTSKK